VRVSANELTFRARVYDSGVLRALNELAGTGQGWRGSDVQITAGDRSGTGRVEKVDEESMSGAFTDVELTAKVQWAQGSDATSMGTSGYTAEDLTEVGVRVGLLGEVMPANLERMSFLAPADDPLGELQEMHVPEGVVQGLSRLLVVEHLVGSRRVGAIERLVIGPPRNHERHVEIAWREPRRYTNREPEVRRLTGVRRWS
jgi:hypothetical protein